MHTTHRTDAQIHQQMEDEVNRFTNRIDELTSSLMSVRTPGKSREMLIRNLHRSVGSQVAHLYNSREPRD